MALAFPSFYTQKPKERTRVSTKRIEKEFDPPKLCKGRLPFDKLIATPIIQGIAYAGYLDTSIFRTSITWKEWELYDGLKAIGIMGYRLYIPKDTQKLVLEKQSDYPGYGQYYVTLGSCGYNAKPETTYFEDSNVIVDNARMFSLKWGKGWLIRNVSTFYQGRIMQTEEFMKVWEEALKKELQ